MARIELRISDNEVQVRAGRSKQAVVPVGDFVRALARAANPGPDVLLPRGVRVARRRGELLAVAVEVPPGARRVRWIRDDSPEPFGPKATYREVYLAFPFVIVLLVLHRGQPTGQQQLFFRRAPLEEADDALLLPNMYNVAEGYGQRCWLCLQHLSPQRDWTANRTVEAVIDHTFSAAFNRSADIHEGNSYWEATKGLDPRIASVEAWEEATRADRFFPLEVEWKPAGTGVSAELDSMVGALDAPLPAEPDASQLAGLVTRARTMRRRRSVPAPAEVQP
jgi:hypothetical protein